MVNFLKLEEACSFSYTFIHTYMLDPMYISNNIHIKSRFKVSFAHALYVVTYSCVSY